jgi:uncharacterized membrane protein
MQVTGVFWGTWFTMTRSIGEFSAAEFIHIGKVIIANVAGPMRILMPASILFLGLSTWMDYRKKSRAFYPMLASLMLMVITLLITVLVEVPIDDQIKTWTTMTVPDDWEAIRAKWAWYHGLRTITAIGSFAFFSFAAVVLGNFAVNGFPFGRRCREVQTQ